MFSVGLGQDGIEDPSTRIICNLFQLIDLFPGAKFNTTPDELKDKLPTSCPPGADPGQYFKVVFAFDMDPQTKKYDRATILPMHQIFNNPNISITPSLPLPKPLPPASTSRSSASTSRSPASTSRPPASTSRSPASTSRPSWGVPPVSPPVSILPVSCETDKLAQNSKETQNNSKRTSSFPISNRTIKKPRLSITKPTNPRKDYKPIIQNQVVNHQIKKNDTIVSSINTATSIPSTSNAVIRSSQEIVCCAQSTKDELQPSNPELNCKDNSSHLNIKKNEDGVLKTYYFMTENQFKFDDISINNSRSTNSNQEMVQIKTKNEMFVITRPEMVDELILAVGMAMKKTVTKEELETLKQTSDVLQSPKLDWSSETKNIPSTSCKTSPASHNNISNSINQSNQVGINKSQKQTINLKQPSKQTTKSSNVTKQQSTSSNMSTKMQHSTIKQTDIKHNVSNNQPNNTSLKHTIATATHVQTSNKQKLNSNQLPVSSKHSMVVSTTKKVVNLYQNVKPAVTFQSTIKDVKKCIKCKALSDDEVCAACRMSSHLKNVTVTRIETPAIITPESPVITPVKPIEIPSCSVNPVSTQESIVLLSSGDEEENVKKKSLEPVITKVENKEALKKHIDKLSLNPKLLEDRLWQKDFSIKDYFKIEECQSVHIGSFKTIPTPSGDMLVCLHGIRMTIIDCELEPVTIDIPMENIVKILAFYGDNPLIIVYTNHLAAFGIQYLLNMKEGDKNYYDPLNKDSVLNKIIWFFTLKKPELTYLEKLLLKLPKKKYEQLTINQVTKLLSLHKKDEEILKLEKEEKDKANLMITVLEDKLGERMSVIKVMDFKMLGSNEFVNDILVEYYLNYWYNKHLSDEDKNRTYIFSTYFYSILSKSFSTTEHDLKLPPSKVRHERVRKWTKNVDIFKKDFIFIPINESLHWFMAVICFPYLSGKVNMKDGTPVNMPDDNIGRYQLPPIEFLNTDRTEVDPNVEDLWLFDPNSTQDYAEDKRCGVDYETDVANFLKNRHTLVKRPCILIFDSLSGGFGRARVTATLREWLEQEYMAKHNGAKKDFDPNMFKGSLVKVPQQPNYTDCGLFAIHYFKRFFERPLVDYTLPIRYLENWFHTDEVAKNCKKRRELHSIILNRMQERGSILPDDFQLPVLDFTDPPVKTPHNPQHSHNHQKMTHPSDVSNSTNLSNRYNSSNRLNPPNHSNQLNPHKPSTSQNQPKPPDPPKYQNRVIKKNSLYYNHEYYDDHNEELDDESIESMEEDVDRQFNENDQYDDDGGGDDVCDDDGDDDDVDDDDEEEVEEEEEVEVEEEVEEVEEENEYSQPYARGEYYRSYQNQRGEYMTEMVENIEQNDDEEGLEPSYDHNPLINEFHHVHSDNRNVVNVNDLRSGSGSHRNVITLQTIPNENFQSFRPNNHNVYNNDDDEYDVIEDEDDDIDQIHHHNPNHDINDDEEEDYNEPNSTINHNRRDNRFNHRLSN